MELKTNYQYTYFIHPFVMKEEKFTKYIIKLLKDKNCKLKVFQKEKELRLYKYFLPKARDFLFSSFNFSNNKIKKLEELPLETRAAVLAKAPCNIFEYTLEKNIQGKIDGKSGIFFNIIKMEIICFNTGICFLCIKTNVEEQDNFANILNFNYKFRDINNDVSNFDGYDNIRLQTDSFSDVEIFRDFIKNITGSNIEAMKMDIDTERFLTYSYACIDQEAWNSANGFEAIKHNFVKLVNVLPADSNVNVDLDKVEAISKLKYAKIGLTKVGMSLFASSTEMNNYTILPEEFENQYLYTYILNLYKKIYLKKIISEFKEMGKVKEARKKFVNFTKHLWIQEITENEVGTVINHKLQKVLELQKLYNEVKNEYDVLYKDLNIEKNKKVVIFIAIILGLSLVFNILNYIALMKI